MLEDALLQFVPGDVKQHVTKARDRYNLAIREALRAETGLRMGRFELADDDRGNHRSRDTVAVPITVRAGLPEVLATNPRCFEDAKLGRWRPTLENLRTACAQAREMILEVDDVESNATTLAAIAPELDRVHHTVSEVLDELDRSDPVRALLAVNEDVLGVYRYSFSRATNFPTTSDTFDQRIELYWLVIGLVAQLLNCSIEALTGVVLAHELAHAYTQAGFDIDGENWQGTSFLESELEVKEGLAQYYTHRICDRFRDKFPELKPAFAQLEPKQPPAYQTHREWIEQFRPEDVRVALLRSRRSGCGVELREFKNALGAAKTMLKRP